MEDLVKLITTEGVSEVSKFVISKIPDFVPGRPVVTFAVRILAKIANDKIKNADLSNIKGSAARILDKTKTVLGQLLSRTADGNIQDLGEQVINSVLREQQIETGPVTEVIKVADVFDLLQKREFPKLTIRDKGIRQTQMDKIRKQIERSREGKERKPRGKKPPKTKEGFFKELEGPEGVDNLDDFIGGVPGLDDIKNKFIGQIVNNMIENAMRRRGPVIQRINLGPDRGFPRPGITSILGVLATVVSGLASGLVSSKRGKSKPVKVSEKDIQKLNTSLETEIKREEEAGTPVTEQRLEELLIPKVNTLILQLTKETLERDRQRELQIVPFREDFRGVEVMKFPVSKPKKPLQEGIIPRRMETVTARRPDEPSQMETVMARKPPMPTMVAVPERVKAPVPVGVVSFAPRVATAPLPGFRKGPSPFVRPNPDSDGTFTRAPAGAVPGTLGRPREGADTSLREERVSKKDILRDFEIRERAKRKRKAVERAIKEVSKGKTLKKKI